MPLRLLTSTRMIIAKTRRRFKDERQHKKETQAKASVHSDGVTGMLISSHLRLKLGTPGVLPWCLNGDQKGEQVADDAGSGGFDEEMVDDGPCGGGSTRRWCSEDGGRGVMGDDKVVSLLAVRLDAVATACDKEDVGRHGGRWNRDPRFCDFSECRW
ncbi:hypothetical protein LR48_Vigan08g054100 [Vigna angularis]|uniref:Uncharacterized protein n=1 Tax=Phaseolus angularis TaxID=3914 RepID=A0A0L9V4Q5_PHAAN|nr:hypothetical protein LR48_Vigan08g054100 [Vigna angularis]